MESEGCDASQLLDRIQDTIMGLAGAVAPVVGLLGHLAQQEPGLEGCRRGVVYSPQENEPAYGTRARHEAVTEDQNVNGFVDIHHRQVIEDSPPGFVDGL